MKKKIGFIDLHLDEWHANHYPEWFRAAKRAAEFDVYMAYEESPAPNLRPLKDWCKDYGMVPATSIEEVIDKCDALCVLAPSNPEVHERLADLPLKSGKPVYIDKPFAPSREAALRLFDLAEQYHTPMFSSSALRFGDELIGVRAKYAQKDVDFMATCSSGSSYWEYAIHQLEMIVSVMGTGIKRIMRNDTIGNTNVLLMEFEDGRRASLTLNPCTPTGARIYFQNLPSVIVTETHNDFQNLLDAVLEMFATGAIPVDKRETLEIAHVLDVSIRAEKTPGMWVNLNS